MSNRRSSEAERGGASGRNTAGLTGAHCPNALLALLEAAQSAMAVINERVPASAARGPDLATRRAHPAQSAQRPCSNRGHGVRGLALRALPDNARDHVSWRRSWSAEDDARRQTGLVRACALPRVLGSDHCSASRGVSVQWAEWPSDGPRSTADLGARLVEHPFKTSSGASLLAVCSSRRAGAGTRRAPR
jgi:hypothetical protein